MMKHLYSFLLISALCLSILPAQTMTQNLQHDGENRSYRIHIPPGYSPGTPVPLVFNLHGLGSNAIEQEVYAGFVAIADTANFILIHPNGINSAWNAGFIFGGIDDLGFISALIDETAASYDIDLSRVYSMGMSNGGFMSYHLACELSDRIAAIASVTGSMITPAFESCSAQRPVPILQMHGTNDNVVSYEGSSGLANIDSVFFYWAAHNQCSGNPDTTDMPDIDTSDSSTVQWIRYDSCDAQTAVHLYKVENGGHSWPGAFPVPTLGVTNQDINGSALIWEFFRQHSHPNPADPSTGLDDALDITVKVFPNPASDQWQLQWESIHFEELRVYDMQGRLIDQQALSPHDRNAVISATGLAKGMYVLSLVGENGQKHIRLMK